MLKLGKLADNKRTKQEEKQTDRKTDKQVDTARNRYTRDRVAGRQASRRVLKLSTLYFQPRTLVGK